MQRLCGLDSTLREYIYEMNVKLFLTKRHTIIHFICDIPEMANNLEFNSV